MNSLKTTTSHAVDTTPVSNTYTMSTYKVHRSHDNEIKGFRAGCISAFGVTKEKYNLISSSFINFTKKDDLANLLFPIAN